MHMFAQRNATYDIEKQTYLFDAEYQVSYKNYIIKKRFLRINYNYVSFNIFKL